MKKPDTVTALLYQYYCSIHTQLQMILIKNFFVSSATHARSLLKPSVPNRRESTSNPDDRLSLKSLYWKL